MSGRPWNEPGSEPRMFWDPTTSSEHHTIDGRSLKERLRSPGGMKFEEILRDIATGLSQVMDVIDDQDHVVDLTLRESIGYSKVVKKS